MKRLSGGRIAGSNPPTQAPVAYTSAVDASLAMDNAPFDTTTGYTSVSSNGLPEQDFYWKFASAQTVDHIIYNGFRAPGGAVVAISGFGYWTSPDGVTWTMRTNGTSATSLGGGVFQISSLSAWSAVYICAVVLGDATFNQMWVGDIRLYDSTNTEIFENVTGAPPNLSGYLAADGSIKLSWSAVGGATSYSVYRGTSAGGEGGTPYQTGIVGLTYSDSSVVAGTEYWYTVTATVSGVESSQSNEYAVSARHFAFNSPLITQPRRSTPTGVILDNLLVQPRRSTPTAQIVSDLLKQPRIGNSAPTFDSAGVQIWPPARMSV